MNNELGISKTKELASQNCNLHIFKHSTLSLDDSLSKEMETEYYVYTPDQFLEIGLELIGAEERKSYWTELSLFKQHYRLDPEICCELWELLVFFTDLDILTQPEHLLWALCFMRTYAKLEDLCNRFHCCEDTFRKYTHHVIDCIGVLKVLRYVKCVNLRKFLCK